MIALDNDVLNYFIRIFIKKEAIQINKNIQNFIKYLRLPVVISIYQNKAFQNPIVAKQQVGFFRLIKVSNLEEIYKKTELKLILSLSKSNFPYINIFQDEFENNFTSTYKINSNKSKLYLHIESLIKAGNKIEIFDKYLLFNNGDNINTDNSHYSIKFIENILNSCKNIEIKIFCKDRDNNRNQRRNQSQKIQDRKSYIENLQHLNILIFDNTDFDEHDRYIRIYKNNNLKYEIILSSGIFNILNPNKDISYIIRILN